MNTYLRQNNQRDVSGRNEVVVELRIEMAEYVFALFG